MRCLGGLGSALFQLARTLRALVGTISVATTRAGAMMALLVAKSLVFVAFVLAMPHVRSRETKRGASSSLVIIPFRGLPTGVGVKAGRIQLGDTVIDVVGMSDGSVDGHDGKA